MDARALALENARKVHARKVRSQIPAAPAPMSAPAPAPAAQVSVPTFREMGNDYLTFLSQSRRAESTIEGYRRLLTNWHYPAIGDLPVNQVQSNDILSFIKPNWTTKHKSANLALMLTNKILEYADGHDYIQSNPVPKVVKSLPKIKHEPKHAEFIKWQDMPDAFDTIGACRSNALTKLAFAFMFLTGARAGALSAFEWEDIQETEHGYHLHIPEDRKGQKTAAGFKIPLSTQAMRVLDLARVGSPETGNIFSIGKRAIGTMMMRQGLVSGVSSHGARTTFTTWAHETTEYPKDLIDECLAHNVNNAVQAAYFQSDRLERRRAVMQEYADAVMPVDTMSDWSMKVLG